MDTNTTALTVNTVKYVSQAVINMVINDSDAELVH